MAVSINCANNVVVSVWKPSQKLFDASAADRPLKWGNLADIVPAFKLSIIYGF